MVSLRVFVTGATGFVGSAVVRELVGAGHQVMGLARNDAAAAALADLGADVHRGDLSDHESLRAGARAAQGVVHTAFMHNFSDYEASAAADLQAVTAMLAVLEGSDKPFVATSVTGFLARGRLNTEEDEPDPARPLSFRATTEKIVIESASHGIRTCVVRLPHSVHGAGDRGFLPALIGIARRTGVAAYVGDGTNRWAAVHRLDAAELYRLALERAPAGSRLHATAEEGVALRDVARVIARRLKLGRSVGIEAEKAAAHFGWLAGPVQNDNWVSSERTRGLMKWRPIEAGLLKDLDSDAYFG